VKCGGLKWKSSVCVTGLSDDGLAEFMCFEDKELSLLLKLWSRD